MSKLAEPAIFETAAHADSRKVTLTNVQWDKLAEVLATCVDDDTIRYDWNEPETADFIGALTGALRSR